MAVVTCLNAESSALATSAVDFGLALDRFCRARVFQLSQSMKAEMLTIDDDRNDADNEVDVASAFKHLNQLRTHFRAGDSANCHDKSEAQIDVAERAVTFRRHHRFADDVGQISADGEVPVDADEAKGWSGDKTSADSKESTENADQKPDDDQDRWG